MTYNVLSGTLNPTRSLTHSVRSLDDAVADPEFGKEGADSGIRGLSLHWGLQDGTRAQ